MTSSCSTGAACRPSRRLRRPTQGDGEPCREARRQRRLSGGVQEARLDFDPAVRDAYAKFLETETARIEGILKDSGWPDGRHSRPGFARAASDPNGRTLSGRFNADTPAATPAPAPAGGPGFQGFADPGRAGGPVSPALPRTTEYGDVRTVAPVPRLARALHRPRTARLRRVVWWQTATMPVSPMYAKVGPTIFPYLTSIGLAIMAVVPSGLRRARRMAAGR